ncbi:MgtC/SapB family protein [Methanolobus sp. ZRKC3]|uniref:MgtC/SapB family protein n=1 Tax=Methanolobus sp. ZRKC3 TaxID=3125786 RepID=UPI0032460480
MIGILIGVEREHWRADKKILAGVRTFSITCITGMIAGFLVDYIGPEILIICTLFAAILSVSLVYTASETKGRSGLTSSVSLFSTYLLGIIVSQGLFLIAIITSLLITFLLIEKKPLHSFAEHLSEKDIKNALQFLALAFVLYPIAPEELLLGIVNLKSAILIVVLVSTISFVSYISLKKMGARGGIPYSGFFGGFISSEATIAALASMSKNRPLLKDELHIGSMLAVVSMIISNTIIALIIDTSGKTAVLMAPPFIVMGILTLVFVAMKDRTQENIEETITLESPFALGPALKFGAVFTLLVILANAANDVAGPLGAYATALGGVVSSSAVTASMAALAFGGSISYQTAAETAIIAGLVSTISKPFYMRITGSREFFRTSVKSFVAIFLAGLITLIVWSGYIRSIVV